MRRRDFIALICCALPYLREASAQQIRRIPRIGMLSPFSLSDTVAWQQAFLRGLHDRGWKEGTNIAIEYRYGDGKNEVLPRLVAELCDIKVDILVTAVTSDTLAAKNATQDIPIVMVAAGDPVATGIVQSLAHPGGNITGLSSMNVDLSGKHLEVLREINPAISSIAVLFNPENSISALGWSEFRVLSQQTSITLRQFEARSIAELDKVLGEIAGAHMGALAIMPDPIFTSRLKRIADFALKMRMPSIFHLKEFVKAGGLLSYGVDRDDLFRRAAGYVDKILKGARPAELPIEQPTKFELAVNLKTAKALGLTIPDKLLATVDEVVE